MVNEGMKGCVQTLFGGATWGNQAEHRLDKPRSVLYDPAGFVLVTDSHHLWKVHLDGAVELLAGSHLSHATDGSGDAARFSYPNGMARAPDGGIYVADCKNNCIRKVSPMGEVTTVAGFCSTLTKYTNQFSDGTGETARFYCPTDVALTPDGTLVVVDRTNARIRRVTVDGTVTTIAGVGPVEVEEGEGQIGFLDGKANEARFNDPQSVLVDKQGIIYVAESFNCKIRRINTKKGEHGEVSTWLGESDTLLGVGGYVDGAGKKVKFSYPHGMIFTPNGDILIADTGNSAIRKITRSGRVSTLYGKPGPEKYIDGPIDQASFMTPMDLALGPDGSLFVVDTAANRLRWIVP
jgi:DNA-binding beta-propeller fold protein YncE